MRFPLPRRVFRRSALAGAATAVLVAGLAAGTAAASTTTGTPAAGTAMAGTATAGTAGTSATTAGTGGRSLRPGTRLYTPPPSSGAAQQIAQLAASGDGKDARLLAEMEAYPRAVWFTSGTPGQVRNQVKQTMAAAAGHQTVPVLVAYDIPGRDCAQYSSGGALNEADYDAWIDGFAQGIGQRKAIVIVEPDGLGNLPSDCGLSSTSYPFTDAERYAEVQHAVKALEADPGASVYLDATHSAWQSVGTMSQRLLAADEGDAQGFYVNVSNYQPTPNLVDYGTWISDCLAMVTDASNPYYQNPSACASQYYPATPSDFSTWDLTTQWYAANMDGAQPTAHFVIDTSRNGQGPNNMQSYASAPYDQPSSVISTLAGGNWCNPPASGLGLRPTTSTGTPLLDAYLWVKTPGQSDGQCDAAGGVRAWDYADYSQAGWPTDATGQSLFDPLWGQDDPAAGAWFPQQALQLAQLARPALP